MTIKRIVVGIDGSKAADRALWWAAGLSHDVGADVVPSTRCTRWERWR
jgi:nucleotide-binding universal stress UspA family protein